MDLLINSLLPAPHIANVGHSGVLITGLCFKLIVPGKVCILKRSNVHGRDRCIQA
jgi:hypothetical protein